MNTPSTTSRLRFVLPVLSFWVFLALVSCSSEPPALTIGEVGYTESELLGFNGNRRTRLAELTAFGLAVSRGEGVELGQPLIQRRIQESILDALEKEVTLKLAGLDEEALAARYRADPEYELTVRHLVLLVEQWETEEEEAQAREKAEAALARIRAGEDFATVAGEVSEEPGAAERGGLLEPGRRGSWVPEFWNAANALASGEVSPVIRTQYGFHVLKLEGRTPLPFSEARYTFVERTSMLASPQPEALEAWADSVSSALSVDSATLHSALEEAGSLFTLVNDILPQRGLETQVASWPGGEFTAGELRAHLISQDRASWEHLRIGGVGELLRTAHDAARRSLLVGTAHGMGISLPPATRQGHLRNWEVAVQGWAQGLGFQEGMGKEAVKATALDGVGSTNQGVALARQEVQNWAPLLLSFYPIGPN